MTPWTSERVGHGGSQGKAVLRVTMPSNEDGPMLVGSQVGSKGSSIMVPIQSSWRNCLTIDLNT